MGYAHRHDKVERKPVNVLNLFAYTGGATVACASAGASVCHVDSARNMVERARENMELSGLSERPVRYIVDDCKKFVRREINRGRRYDALIMDPPSYGRGPNGELWKIEEDLYDFVELCSGALEKTPLFVLINSYTTGLQPAVLKNILTKFFGDRGGRIEAYEVCLPTDEEGIVLPCGASGLFRSDKAEKRMKKQFTMEDVPVLYEDKHIIVVVKPQNMPSQEDKSGDTDLFNLLKEYIRQKYDKQGNVFLGLVHRLDRTTGGLMVFAKNSKCAARLSEAIKNGEVDKRYLAVLVGKPREKSATLVNYLKKNSLTNTVYVATETTGGRQALGAFVQAARFGGRRHFSCQNQIGDGAQPSDSRSVFLQGASRFRRREIRRQHPHEGGKSGAVGG